MTDIGTLLLGSADTTPDEIRRTADYLAAFEAWLATVAGNTQRAYRRAHEDLLAYTTKCWWQITSADVMRWMADLKSRPIDRRVRKGLLRCRGRAEKTHGLADSTVGLYLAAISSFYSFIGLKYVVTGPDGHEQALWPVEWPNPARVVQRPVTRSFAESNYLDREQLRAFFNAIERSARENPIQSARDYALFRVYVGTGMRSTAVRTLAWGDLVRRGAEVLFRWDSKGKSGLTELPGSAWDAIQRYLRLAGRLDGMADGDYIFTALSDRARRLPNVGNAFEANRPLSGREVGRLAKHYARLAGLDGDRIHVHMFRHSAAMALDAAGADVKDVQRFLNHSSSAVTDRYLHALHGERNDYWQRVDDYLGF